MNFKEISLKNHEMERILIRGELYDLIWTKPLKEVAEEIELSINTLKKICKDYVIPLPKKGHWTKIAFGKEVERTQTENENRLGKAPSLSNQSNPSSAKE